MKNAAQSAAADAATELLNEDLGIFDAAPEAEAEGEQAEETTVEAEAQQEVVQEEEIPEDILALVETPDFEAEAEAEVESYLAHEAEEATLDDDYENEWDPEKKELIKRLRAAEKKAEFYEAKRVEAEQGKWKQEAEKYFPFADTSQIQATSRRGFLREAKQLHDVEKAKAAQLEDRIRPKIIAELKDSLRAEVEAELRQELKLQAADAWGKPHQGSAVPGPSSSQEERIDRAFRTKGLAEGIKAMFANE